MAENRKTSITVPVVVAVICACLAVAGFVLYFTSKAPSDAAAKVGDTYITEQSVNDYISMYRKSNSVTDDAAFATSLATQGTTVYDFRVKAIEQLALSAVIDKKAKELGATADEKEVQEQVDAAKNSFAFNDDSIWTETLEQYGMTEEGIREQYKINIEKQNIAEKEVSHRDPTDAELLTYIQTYLPETTQKHAYRIVFKGDNAETRAKECHSALFAEYGYSLDTEKFSNYAKQYSDDENVQQDGGSYAWSGSSMDTDERTLMEDVEVNACTEAGAVGDDGTWEILYCDTTYTFPTANDLTEIPADLPQGLRDEIAKSASNALWQADSEAYFSKLLSDTQLTCYPIPENAGYNVDLSLANETQ